MVIAFKIKMKPLFTKWRHEMRPKFPVYCRSDFLSFQSLRVFHKSKKLGTCWQGEKRDCRWSKRQTKNWFIEYYIYSGLSIIQNHLYFHKFLFFQESIFDFIIWVGCLYFWINWSSSTSPTIEYKLPVSTLSLLLVVETIHSSSFDNQMH